MAYNFLTGANGKCQNLQASFLYDFSFRYRMTYAKECVTLIRTDRQTDGEMDKTTAIREIADLHIEFIADFK